jgi:small subunit ribosomal protein S3
MGIKLVWRKRFCRKTYGRPSDQTICQCTFVEGWYCQIVIERTLKRITVTIHTSRPGLVIGKGGNEVDKLKEELKKLTNKDVQINIYEIKTELEAQLVAENIASQSGKDELQKSHENGSGFNHESRSAGNKN